MSDLTDQSAPVENPYLTADPVELIRQARGGFDEGQRQVLEEDDGFRVPKRDGGFYDPGRARKLLNNRPILLDIDFGPAAPTVDAAKACRSALTDAERELSAARRAVEPADSLDADALVEAKVVGGKPWNPKDSLGSKARQRVKEADVDAAVALRQSELAETAVVQALAEHGFEIRSASQAEIDRMRRELIEHATAAGSLIASITALESGLGDFERNHVAPLVDPELVIDLRPADAPPGWRAPDGSSHGNTLRQELTLGRAVPPLHGTPVETILQWTELSPFISAYRPTEEGGDSMVTKATPEPTPMAHPGMVDLKLP